jgi:hypothetical protein
MFYTKQLLVDFKQTFARARHSFHQGSFAVPGTAHLHHAGAEREAGRTERAALPPSRLSAS